MLGNTKALAHILNHPAIQSGGGACWTRQVSGCEAGKMGQWVELGRAMPSVLANSPHALCVLTTKVVLHATH